MDLFKPNFNVVPGECQINENGGYKYTWATNIGSVSMSAAGSSALTPEIVSNPLDLTTIIIISIISIIIFTGGNGI
jgi:hypothetical protein